MSLAQAVATVVPPGAAGPLGDVLAASLQSGTPTPASTPIVDSRSGRYLWSGLVLVVFLTLMAGVYAVGPRLKNLLDDGAAEAIQSGLVTVAGIAGGVLLVLIWGQTRKVTVALSEVRFGPEAGVRMLIVLVALGVSYTITRVTKRLIRLGEGRDAITIHQREVLHHVVQIIVFLPAILFGLRLLFGVPPENLLLGAGAVSLVVGLAARHTLASVLAGFVLLFSRPFEVGDWVVIDDDEGIVTDVTIFNTRLRTFDEEHVMIPNDRITDSAVTNRSKNKYLRVRVNVGVDYETDIEHAASVAMDAMRRVDAVSDRRSPEVVVEEFGDSAVVLELRFWIDHPTIHRKWDAQNAVIEAVKSAFEDEGISIPFPQRVLTGREQAGGLHVRGGAVDARADSTAGDGHDVKDRATDGSAADGSAADDPDADETGVDQTGVDQTGVDETTRRTERDDETTESTTERDDD